MQEERDIVTRQEQTTAEALRRAAHRATLAPSIHNTQPWHFEIRDGRLRFFTDRTRQLRVLDPRARQLTISMGCAVFNARVSLAADGFHPRVRLLPDASRPDLIAEFAPVPSEGQPADIAGYKRAIETRQTNRRPFSDEPVPSEVIDAVVAAGRAEGALVRSVTSERDRFEVAWLSRRADEIEMNDPAYRAELRAWTTTDPARHDGVPSTVVPHVAGATHDEVAMRDFDSSGAGWLPAQTSSSSGQALLILGTTADSVALWLRAGQALERMLLEITRHGYVASPLTQAVEVATTREALRRRLDLRMQPHLLLRVGRAPAVPGTLRRPLTEVLTESDQSARAVTESPY